MSETTIGQQIRGLSQAYHEYLGLDADQSVDISIHIVNLPPKGDAVDGEATEPAKAAGKTTKPAKAAKVPLPDDGLATPEYMGTATVQDLTEILATYGEEPDSDQLSDLVNQVMVTQATWCEQNGTDDPLAGFESGDEATGAGLSREELQAQSLPQLRETATANGIDPGKMTKKQLVDALAAD